MNSSQAGEDFLQQLQLDNLPQQLLESKMMQNQQQSYQQGSNSPLASNNNYHSQQQKPGYTSKKCNCKQSQCIKLYCECYAAGVYCNGCHCVNCKNNDQSEGWRNQAIQNTLVKNPTAFLPKISQKAEATSKVVDPLNLGKHNKGCACKRSGCMKKYCECFQAGVPCSENCKCTDCQNTGFVSHGNLLRQFREDDSYNSQNQILHKFLLAHNEEHLTSILGEQNGGTEFGIYKKGIPIKSDFIEDSCMKLLQILHLPDEDIFKRRDQILLEKYNKNHTLILKEEHQQESNINQKKEDRILKTPPQKSKRPDGTAGEGEGQKSGENYNKDSYDIDLACQDENMDEEDDHVDHNKQNNYNKGDSKEDKIVKGSAGEHFNKDSEILSMNKDISESNQTESTAVSSINKFKPFSQKTDVKPPQKFAEESQKDGDKIECEEDEQHQNQIKPEEEKKESHEEEKNKEEEHENNGNEGKEGEIEEETEGVHKKQVRLRHNMEHLGNEMDIECHSSALKRKQELYEIRRSFILETFIDLLRHVEQTI